MSKIAKNFSDLIGNTPLLDISDLALSHGSQANLFAKLECLNPLGSVKDRAAFCMIEDAKAQGKLKENGQIIEATSGNTGIGLAWIAAELNYRLTIVMPDSMSVERQKLLLALGVELVLTPGKDGMKGAIAKANQIADENPDAVMLKQFENPANTEAHRKSTGPEIWNDMGGEIDAFIAGVGTGGTLIGTGSYLKEKNSALRLIAVEPEDSAVLSGKKAGSHKLQGIGAGFVPKIYDASIVDEIVEISTGEAYSASRELAKRKGLLIGISSGAALAAAYKITCRDEFVGKNVLVLLPDSGERYLSGDLFE